MRIKEIYESFNSVYRVERLGDKVKFMTEDGLQYTIEFDRFEGNLALEFLANKHKLPLDFFHPQAKSAHVVFHLNVGDANVTKFDDRLPKNFSKNPMRVYATVMDEIFRFAHLNNIDIISFSGREKLGSLYKRLVKSFVPKEYDFKIKDSNRSEFLIYKKSMINEQ